jgi:hypothetical protein
MTDFWEALGRMACDKKLQHGFFATQPLPHTIEKERTPNGNEALHIPEAGYSEIQTFFCSKLSQRCLSLMACGELRLSASYMSSRDALAEFPAIIAKAHPEVTNPSPGYFISLGIIIADKTVRDNLNEGKWSGNELPPMSDDEEKQIKFLSALPECEKTAIQFCFAPWGGGCNARLSFWDGHLHPEAANKYGRQGDTAEAAVAALAGHR